MARLLLSDERWSKLKEIMLQHKIYNKPNLRMIVEAMLYRMRVGCPWRDLPIEFGFWHSIYQRQWKINLIETLNPQWCDLYEDICC